VVKLRYIQVLLSLWFGSGGVEERKMSAAPKISPEGNAYRLDSRDRIILEFNRPMRTALERFQRDDGGWDLKVTVLEIDDNSWEERSE
jgi:hypothetical protein